MSIIFTDEMLSAFLDGELPEADMARIEEALLTDKVLDARLSKLQQANDAVRDAYESFVNEPVPSHLVDLIKKNDDGRNGLRKTGESSSSIDVQDEDNVVAFPTKPSARRDRQWSPAIAASIALVIGLGIGVIQPFSTQTGGGTGLQVAGPIPHGTPVFAALENSASSERTNLYGGTEIEPILSFKSVDGEYCREAVLHQQTEQVIFVACRASDSWNVQLVVKEPAQANTNDSFRPASAEAQTAIDAFLSKKMGGDAFDQEQEIELIGRSWQD